MFKFNTIVFSYLFAAVVFCPLTLAQFQLQGSHGPLMVPTTVQEFVDAYWAEQKAVKDGNKALASDYEKQVLATNLDLQVLGRIRIARTYEMRGDLKSALDQYISAHNFNPHIPELNAKLQQMVVEYDNLHSRHSSGAPAPSRISNGRPSSPSPAPATPHINDVNLELVNQVFSRRLQIGMTETSFEQELRAGQFGCLKFTKSIDRNGPGGMTVSFTSTQNSKLELAFWAKSANKSPGARTLRMIMDGLKADDVRAETIQAYMNQTFGPGEKLPVNGDVSNTVWTDIFETSNVGITVNKQDHSFKFYVVQRLR